MNGIKLFFLSIGTLLTSFFGHGENSINTIENKVLQVPTIYISQPVTQPKISGTITPTETPMATPTPTPTPKPGYSINDFLYPGATQVQKSDTAVELTSTDDPSKIYNWYEDNVNSLKVAKNSSVNSSINGYVNAHIDAANYSFHIQIDITKNESDNNTTIQVTITPLQNANANTLDNNTTIIQGSTATHTTIINNVDSSSN